MLRFAGSPAPYEAKALSTTNADIANKKAMYPLSVATVVNGQNAKPVGASLLAMLLPLVIYVRTRQFDDAFAQPGSPASWLLHRAERISNS